jgi:protein-tyrosine-phosphatase
VTAPTVLFLCIHNAGRTPRRWSDSDLEAADVVVTMGCGDTCP